jgi:hypothetical protein
VSFHFVFFNFCRSTENDHVKSSLPSKLHRIRYFGTLELEDFKDLISKEDYLACINAKKKHNTWYPLTIDVFVSFLYKVITFPYFDFSPFNFHLLCWLTFACNQREISAASDAAARAYKDETPADQRTALGVWRAMTLAEEKAKKSFRSKSFEKYVAVANSENTDAFFDEVLLFIFSSPLICPS